MLPGLVSGYLARVSDPKRVFVFLDVLQEGPQVRGIEWTKLWLRDDRRSLSLVLVGDTVKHSRNDDFHFICSPVKFFNRESKERDTESPLPFLSAFRLNRSAIGSAFRNAQKNSLEICRQNSIAPKPVEDSLLNVPYLRAIQQCVPLLYPQFI
jgi:hypothetical protein